MLANENMTFASLVSALINLFNTIIPVLVALGLVFFMIGVIRYIRHAGKAADRTIILWSLVALFVMMSFWGILRVMSNTFLGSSSRFEEAPSSWNI